MKEERKRVIKIKEITGIKIANCYSCLYHEETETDRHFCALNLPKANLTSFPFKKEQASCWEPCFWDSPNFTSILRTNSEYHNTAVHYLFNERLNRPNRFNLRNPNIRARFWYWILKFKHLFSLILKR